ncbi:MAG TPA: response regulator, partial [Pirellulaceae bacterium]|nr:response regulator [Pirellulaceae bacterium]
MPSPSRSVLIVDPSAENREVLRTALERRGLRIFEADQADQGLQMAREHHPHVIVLDLESDEPHASDVEDQYGAEARELHTSLVILGKACRRQRLDAARHVAKPYHFAPLVHTIEQL